jgi:hypothetical protein
VEKDDVIYINFDKVHHRTGHEVGKGSNCIALLFLHTRRVMRLAGQHKTPAALPSGKRPDIRLTYLHFCK